MAQLEPTLKDASKKTAKAAAKDAAKPAKAAPSTEAPAAPPVKAKSAPSEWAQMEPTEKKMGLVRLTLDRGVKTTVIGTLYGLDFELDDDRYRANIFFDYYNRRLKVLSYEATDYPALLERLAWLAEQNDFDKIFFKAKKDDWQVFLAHGYMLEGILKYYFHGEDAYVLSKFRTTARVTSEHLIEESDLIEELTKDPPQKQVKPLPQGYSLFRCTSEHIPQLVQLYRRVFETYPSPLTHPDYILATMERNVLYRGIADENGDLVSAASGEVDDKHSNAEMTDCATHPSQRGKSLMFHILTALEEDLRERGIITAYTLARARSVGMNRVFHRLGYEYSGRLVNNCDIYGQFEDMNIWVRKLEK